MQDKQHIVDICTSTRTLNASVGENYWHLDRDEGRGAEKNRTKIRVAEAAWKAGYSHMQTGCNFSERREYPIERKIRDTRLNQIATMPGSQILSYLSEHVVGMPRGF